MEKDLIFEIGTEEIPSDYLENGLRDFKKLAESYLKDNRVLYKGEIATYGTPRRLVLIIGNVSQKQEDTFQEITGPPKKTAFDSKGNPTKAALGFAKKYRLRVEELEYINTPKGEYLHVRQHIVGKPTVEVLPQVLPKIMADIPWPKSMRWGDVGFTFVRPVHWILALMGEDVIKFEIAGVTSGNLTRGHRFMCPETMEIKDAVDYRAKMEQSHVIIDIRERSQKVEECITEELEGVDARPMEDPELLATVSNLVEFPSAVFGSFNESFLELPDPVLITVMKKHQKYFAVQDNKGGLMPNFLAINNTIAKNPDVVRRGHERVLRARLSDANFFFHEDRKKRLEQRIEDLKEVIYRAELGSSFDKVNRFARLAEFLAEQVRPDKAESVILAAKLCKCDLVTEMVMEFPSLQGTMGMEYARLDGYPEEVCQAIYDHYLPAKSGDDLPGTITGAIVGIADRIDTIIGCFAIGLEPTGDTDPFALRRHALAIIRILDNRNWEISLKGLISKSLDILGKEQEFDRDMIFKKVMLFFRERYRNMMLTAGYESDLIEAVISADFDLISNLGRRLEHLNRFVQDSKEFKSLALTFKRVSNILKNQEGISCQIDPGMFKDPCESILWNSYQDLKNKVIDLIEKKQYLEALNQMSGLRQDVDNFFDGVEVLTKVDPLLRGNRVGILQELYGFFLRLADFSKFSI